MPITDLTGTKWQMNSSNITYDGWSTYASYKITGIVKSGSYTLNSDRLKNGSAFYKQSTSDRIYYNNTLESWIYFPAQGSSKYISAPTVEITGGDDVTNTVVIDWFMDNATQITSATTYDLSQLSLAAGTYSITVKAKASGYRDSDASNSVTYGVAAAPSISVHPQNASYSAGGTATALSVTASVGDGGTLSYKWQKSTDGGTSYSDISGATSSTYTPDVSTVSTYMYRCVVTNTLGATMASTISNAATITVTASGYTVTVSTDGWGNWIGIYDGQNSSAPAVYEGDDTNIPPVTISSGYMFILCGDQNTWNTDASGGVTIINQEYGFDGWVLCTVTGNGSIYVENACYVEGTPITLSDRTYKNVEDITYTDELLVWNFDKGCFDKANPICILRARKALEYNQLTFSDGSVLKTINQHRIFNIEAGKFTYPMTDATPIGTHTLNDKGEVIELVDKRVMVETVVYYNIITKYHINCFASTILTSCRLNNIYPIENLKFIKDGREIKPYEQFNRITRDEYEGYRAGEQPEDINADNSVCFGDKTVEDYIIRCRNNSKPR